MDGTLGDILWQDVDNFVDRDNPVTAAAATVTAAAVATTGAVQLLLLHLSVWNPSVLHLLLLFLMIYLRPHHCRR